MKKYAMGGKMDTKGAMGNTKTRPLGPDEEADLKALETLQQPDYDVGGPKRRFARGKVKRMAGGGMSASKRADGCAVRGKTRGMIV